MNRPRGISADLYRPVRPAPAISRAAPLPADMPGRVHRTASPVISPAPVTTTVHRTFWGKVWDYTQYPLFAVLALIASVNATFGQSAILAYAVIVLVLRRKPSSWSFVIALIILISIPIFTLIGQPTIAENAAIYVYELLVVGTIQAILEMKQTA